MATPKIEFRYKKILTELSKISELTWKQKSIICYAIGAGIPFSDPLTISVYKTSKTNFLDTLTHELIHTLIYTDNVEETEKSWNYFFRKYKSEPYKTIVHIPLHAIHSELISRFYPKSNLELRLRLPPNNQDYLRSWQIVQEQGKQKIINEFKSKIR